MTSFRPHLLTLAIFCGLSFAGVAQPQSKAPTAEQQKKLDAAREDMTRAAKRLAELTREFGGQNFHFEQRFPDSRPLVGVLLGADTGGGVRITGVTPDGAAADAGIRSGDRLLRIDGKTIEGDSPEARVENARRMLREIVEKPAVELRYARGDRETDVKIKPRIDSRVMVFGSDGTMMRPGGDVILRRLDNGAIDLETGRLDLEAIRGLEALRRDRPLDGHDAPHVLVLSDNHVQDDDDGMPSVERRVLRIDCKGDAEACSKQAREQMRLRSPDEDGVHNTQTHVFRFDCKPGETCKGQERLAEAFRWNGLNLSSIDAQLGRYFGTDKGVLVISTGPALGQLQAGDVIQRVDGKPVDTPRAVMDALRDKPADSPVAVDYLRDRKSGNTTLKVPKAVVFPQLPPMLPPPKAAFTPPAPPAPPPPLLPPRVD